MTDIQVKYWTNRENERHNREMEKLGFVQQAEASRHNRAMEQVSALQAATAARGVEVSALQAETAARNADIQNRNVTIQERLLPSNIALNTARMKQADRQSDVLAAQVPSIQADSAIKQAAAWWANVNTGIGFVDNAAKAIGNVVATLDRILGDD